MKIISKYKDYYDYLSGVWGEDPKLVLVRKGEFVVQSTNPSGCDMYVLTFIIGGIMIQIYNNFSLEKKLNSLIPHVDMVKTTIGLKMDCIELKLGTVLEGQIKCTLYKVLKKVTSI